MIADAAEGNMIEFLFLKTFFFFFKEKQHQSQLGLWRMSWNGAVLESGQLIGDGGIGVGEHA